MAQPTIPTGYTDFRNLMRLLAVQHSVWGIHNNWLTHEIAAYAIGDKDARVSMAALRRWISDAEPKNAVRSRLATMLASETLLSAAIQVETGALLWTPAAAWRVEAGPERPNGPTRSAINRACDEGRISIPLRHGPVTAYPLLSVRALAVACGASNLPDPPALMPRGAFPYKNQESAAPPAATLDSDKTSPNKGGRPQEHDWEGMWIAALCWASANELVPNVEVSRPKLREHLLHYFSQQKTEKQREPPDPKTVYKKLTILFRPLDSFDRQS